MYSKSDASLMILKFHGGRDSRISGSINLHEGWLNLSVDRALYQRLGVTGKAEIGLKSGELKKSRISGIRRYSIKLDHNSDRKAIDKIISYPLLPTVSIHLSCSISVNTPILSSMINTISSGIIDYSIREFEFPSMPSINDLSFSIRSADVQGSNTNEEILNKTDAQSVQGNKEKRFSNNQLNDLNQICSLDTIQTSEDQLDEWRGFIEDVCCWAGCLIHQPNITLAQKSPDSFLNTFSIPSDSTGKSKSSIRLHTLHSPTSPIMANHLIDYLEEILNLGLEGKVKTMCIMGISEADGFVLMIYPAMSKFIFVRL